MSSRELTELIAFYSLEPFGEREWEYRAAMLASMIANANRDTEKRKTPFGFEEFMRPGYLGEQAEAQADTDQLIRKSMAIFGGILGAKKA